MKTKFKLQPLILILLSCIFIMAALFLDYRYLKVVDGGIDAESFQETLMQQHEEMYIYLEELAEKVADNPSLFWDNEAKLQELPYSFLIYRHESLVGWTSQLLPIPDSSFHIFDSTIVRLQNGWYYTLTHDIPEQRLVAIFPIKYDYPYQNQYIQNRFNSCFNLDHNGISISSISEKDNFPIYNNEGEYLFSLNFEYGMTQGFNIAIWSFLFLVAAICMMFYSIIWYIKHVLKSEIRFIQLLVVSILFLLFYYLFFVAGWYRSLGAFKLFSPLHFAYSEWLSSIGSFIVLSQFFVFITYLYHQFSKTAFKFFGNRIYLNFTLGYALVMSYYYVVAKLFLILIKHSSDSNLFVNIIEIDRISIAKLLVIFLLFISFSLVFEKLIRQFSFCFSKAKMLFLIAIAMLAFLGCDWLLKLDMSPVGMLFIAALSVYFIYIKKQGSSRYSYRDFLWLVLIFDLYIVAQLFLLNLSKEKESRLFMVESLANNLEGEQDPVAEMFLSELEKSIASDPNIEDMIENDEIYEEDLRQYFIKNYFQGYLSRYDVQVVTCWPNAELYVEGANNSYDCYQYFDSLLDELGEVVYGSSNFYFLRKDDGRVNYFGSFIFFDNNTELETKLFLDLTSKPFFEGLGYPELLISQKEKRKLDILKDYSYAKYVDGSLVKKSGEYLYKYYNDQFFVDSLLDKKFVQSHQFSHLVYSPKQGVEIIMSIPSVSVSNGLIAFSLFYIVFVVLTFALVYAARFNQQRIFIAHTIQERIQIIMVLFMVFLLMVIGSSSVLYSINQFKEKNNDMLSQRLKSIMLELDHKIGSEDVLTSDMAEYLNFLLQKFSNVFYSDINLYGLDGVILATSRPELYQRGIMGNLMNPDAYIQLATSGEREYIHDESIGNLNYLSAYVPFVNQNNQVLAYLNLPYFVGTNELRSEISSVLVAIINAYFVFVLIAISIAVFASRQVTRPLLLIRQRLSQTQLESRNEKIEYNREDEIGQLVNEYNRMVDKLGDSADKLARTQREVAWREMAKQIAHEIKNPLTPMKLSVQYLQKAWDDKADDFDSYIKRVTQTLTDQINQLSVIATEFSHFAKMPKAKRTTIDLMEKLKNTVALFEGSSKVKFSVNNGGVDKIMVFFDAEQMLSVFNNLIKNAVQSIPLDRSGEINIHVIVENGRVRVAIKDNGKGVPDHVREKLFTPNFTTKSSGMGLGLAIVKNIIEGAKGKIWFETEVNVGSIFYISLPLSTEGES